MPARNVNLTPELDLFITTKVEAGLYANTSEVLRPALRLLERDTYLAGSICWCNTRITRIAPGSYKKLFCGN